MINNTVRTDMKLQLAKRFKKGERDKIVTAAVNENQWGNH